MADEEVTFIDMGDHTLVIDNRGPVQKRDTIPKSARDVGVATSMRQELEARIEAEVIAPAKLAEEADPYANLPPAESDEDKAAREKKAKEQIAKADKQAAGGEEEAAAPAPSSSKKS